MVLQWHTLSPSQMMYWPVLVSKPSQESVFHFYAEASVIVSYDLLLNLQISPTPISRGPAVVRPLTRWYDVEPSTPRILAVLT